MRAFSPQDQWKKHKSEPILALSEGLVVAAGRLLALLLVSVVVTRLLLTSGAGLLAFATATTSSTASLSSRGNSGKQGRVILHWLLHGGHQVGLLAMHGP